MGYVTADRALTKADRVHSRSRSEESRELSVVDNPESSQELTFDADRPIESREQDLLGRRSLAESIAENLLTIPVDHGFTAAIIGEWGSGKSSVLNMVTEAVKAEGDAAIVLNFNPWLFGNANDLVARFFRELGAQLGKGGSEKVKAVVGALIELGRGLSPLVPVPGVSIAAHAVGTVAEKALEEKSLLEQRDQLSNSLKELGARVIVVIDDIDRLEPSETRELMRLVRLTSDLPNVVFLLAFDWQHVSVSLREDENDGSQYLDKIVQVRFDIPVAKKEVLSAVLFAGLNDLIAEYEVLQLDSDVWNRVYYDVVRPLLGNLRDVRRYVNSLHVTLDTLGTEVALADLLGLEAIRVLAPKKFELLRVNADLLVPRGSFPQPYRSEQDVAAAINRMLEHEEESPFVLKSVLDTLFPASPSPNRMLFLVGEEAQWRKDRRVACEEVWSTYLRQGLSEEALQTQQVQLLAAALTDADSLAELLDSLDARQTEEALERLEGYQNEYPVEAIPTAVPVLANRLHKLSRRITSPFGVPPRVKGSRVILRLLRREPDQNRLVEVVTELLGRVNSLSGRLALIEMVGHRQNVGHKLVSEEQAKELENQLLHQLLAATTEELSSEWDLTPLVLRFTGFFDEVDRTQVLAKVREHLADDKFVLAFLLSATGEIVGTGGTQTTLPWDAMLEELGEALTEAVRRLANSRLYYEMKEEEREVVDLAVRYSEGWRPPSIGDY